MCIVNIIKTNKFRIIISMRKNFSIELKNHGCKLYLSYDYPSMHMQISHIPVNRMRQI